MDRPDVMKMLAFAEYLFPSFRCDNRNAMIDAWLEVFADVPTEKAMKAMKQVCCCSKFFPSAGEVLMDIHKETDWSGVK